MGQVGGAEKAEGIMSSKSDRLQAKYIEKLRECVEDGDTECAHAAADGLLCDLLNELGYQEVVGVYMRIDKWYA